MRTGTLMQAALLAIAAGLCFPAGAGEADEEEPAPPVPTEGATRRQIVAATDSGQPVLALVFRRNPAHATARPRVRPA